MITTSYIRFFREFNKQTSTATATSALAGSVHYSFIHFFAVLFKAQHENCEKATFCVDNVNYDGQFLELRFQILEAVVVVIEGQNYPRSRLGGFGAYVLGA